MPHDLEFFLFFLKTVKLFPCLEGGSIAGYRTFQLAAEEAVLVPSPFVASYVVNGLNTRFLPTTAPARAHNIC